MKTINIRSEKGGMLVMSVILSFSIFVMGLAFLEGVNLYQKSVNTEISYYRAFFTSNSSRAMTKAEIAMGNISGDLNKPWRVWNKYDDDQTAWRADVRYASQHNELYGSTRGYVVTGYGRSSYFGTEKEYDFTVRQAHITETFADYLYISNCEEDPVRGDSVRFWTPDTLDGKVHSNDTIRVMGSPRFMKRVTTVPSDISPPNNNATFDEGFYGNAAAIHFPDQADEIRRNSSMPHDFGTFNDGEATEITFDGNVFYVRYCGIDTAGYFSCFPPLIRDGDVYDVPNFGCMFVNGVVLIKAARGTVDIMDGDFESSGFSGRLTVASSDTMIIPDNLIYTEANADNSVPNNIIECPSVLGLISENFIMIGKDVRDTVYVNAAMAAIHGSITVQDIYAYSQPNNMKESLFIYGSLAQKNRGIVRTQHLNHFAGFNQKDYHYDTRLRQYPPPFFLSTRDQNELYYERLVGEI